MYHLNYHKSNNTYYLVAEGDTEVSMLLDVLDYICEHCHNHHCLRIITDYRKAEIDKKSVKNLEETANYILTKLLPQFTHIKWASLSLDYIPTTIALILKELIKCQDIEYETYTTERKLCQWMEIDALNPEHFDSLKRI